jgi:signal transduction histidine kinase
LGLSFTKEVADPHGGRILAESELQKSTLFSMPLPIRKDSEIKEVSKEFNENVKEL